MSDSSEYHNHLGLVDPPKPRYGSDRTRTPKSLVEARNRAKERQRLLAVTHYLITGSLTATCQITKIPYNTLNRWKRSDWWPVLEQAVLKKNKLIRSAKMASLADKAQAVVAERLKNGDFQFDQRTGELVRVPVKAVVANRILQDSTTAELEIIKQVERVQEVQTQERMLDKLIAIKQAFRDAYQARNEVSGSKRPVEALEMVEATPGIFEPQTTPQKA